MNAPASAQAQIYDKKFYQYQREGASRSAWKVLPYAIEPLKVRSVLDVGCGAGAWLAALPQFGVDDVLGVDGEYVDRSMLMVEADRFRPQDITKPFDLGRQFDLVQCLEVAEHVPSKASSQVVDNIVRHGKHVLFSAAVPGQGGKDHINEQSYEYWRDLFAARGYSLFDYLRPQLVGDLSVEPWYRYNVLFFAHESAIESLPESVRATRVASSASIKDYSPLAYQLRKLILRALPNSAVSALAAMKHRHEVRLLSTR